MNIYRTYVEKLPTTYAILLLLSTSKNVRQVQKTPH